MHAKDKFIAFIDILGFTAMVEAAELAGGDFTRELELAAALGSPDDSDKFRSHGPTTCPGSQHINKDLDFKVTQISDCIVISAEVSPGGLSNLTHYCFGVVVKMLQENVLCRGYITRGNVHHQAGQFIGTGYMRAYRGERNVAFLRIDETEGGTPFVQIDESVVSYERSP